MSDEPRFAITPTDDPLDLFRLWFADAAGADEKFPEAMTLATADAEGRPDARIVLMKGFDGNGFVFFTNTMSDKGRQLAANARACLNFYWKTLDRQVRIAGPVTPVSQAEADDYYASRPRISRLGAWASDQSRPLPARAEFEDRLARLEADYPGDEIPRPPHWSGYRVRHDRLEFWQDRPFRLHDRLVYTRGENAWSTHWLYP